MRPRILGLCLILVVCMPALAAQIKSVAALDFRNLTPEVKNEWIGHAFGFYLRRKLGQLNDVIVVSEDALTSKQRLTNLHQQVKGSKGSTLKADDIPVDYVIFGSVQAGGSVEKPQTPLRVHARIVNCRFGIVHNALLIDGKMKDLFALQAKLAKAVLKQMKVIPSHQELLSLLNFSTSNLQAYEHFQKGMVLMKKKKYKQAIVEFEWAMKKHEGILYADAHHYLGLCYLKLGKGKELVRRFKGDAERFSIIYYNLARAYEQGNKFKEALDAYRTFLDYNTNVSNLWQITFATSEVETVTERDSDFAIFREENRMICMDTRDGRVLWQRSAGVPRGAKVHLRAKEVYVVQRGEAEKIDVATGKALEKISSKLVPDAKVSEMDFVYATSEREFKVVDKDQKKLLWSYQAPVKSRITGYNQNVLMVMNEKNTLRGFRIQKGSLPTDKEAWLGMARCYGKLGRKKEEDQVYQHLLETGNRE